MQPVALVFASNERYFPGLYAAVASALCYLHPTRQAEVRVLDGGISDKSKEILSHFLARFEKRVKFEFVPVDESIFRGATPGPGRSYMAYCRILLPHLVEIPRIIYLDSDTLVFRDLSELFDVTLPSGRALAAVRDSETPTLGEDSQTLARAMKLPDDGIYFNSGVILLEPKQLRSESFTERSIEFLRNWSGEYRFWDQSAFNFLLHGRIEELPEHWNRPSWRFNEQQNNDLDCVLHFTASAPWLGGTPGPAQFLFERFAAEAGLPVNRQIPDFKRSRRQQVLPKLIAPFRAVAFPLISLFYKLARQQQKSAAYKKAGGYWLDYIVDTPKRLRLHHRRIEEIQRMKFKFAPFESEA